MFKDIYSPLQRFMPCAALVVLLMTACSSLPVTATVVPAFASPTSSTAPTAVPAPSATVTQKPATAQPTAVVAASDAGTVVIAFPDDTDTLDPANAYAFMPAIVIKATYQTLVTFKSNNFKEVQPLLASQWEISADGKVYTFLLRKDAIFNDGAPVTAKDVVFSWNRQKNVKGAPSFLTENFASVRAKDDFTVVLTLSKVDPSTLSRVANITLSIVNSAAVKKHGGTDEADADKLDYAGSWLSQHSEGSGPYTLEKWERTVQTVLARNSKYWGAKPAIEHVIIQHIADAATQKSDLEAGKIDIAMSLMTEQADSLKGNPKITISNATSEMEFYLGMRMDRSGSPISNPKLQQAVRLALDYDGLKRLSGAGAATPASMVPIGIFAAYPEGKAIKRDIAGAKKLLAEAGLGSSPELTLGFSDMSLGGMDIGVLARKVQADLAEAGIKVKLKGSENGAFMNDIFSGVSDFNLWVFGPDYPDPGNYLLMLPTGMVASWYAWTDVNAEKTILDLRKQAEAEMQPEARVKLFAAIQDYLQQHGPYAPFLQPGVHIGVNNTVKGFEYSPLWFIDVSLLSK